VLEPAVIMAARMPGVSRSADIARSIARPFAAPPKSRATVAVPEPRVSVGFAEPGDKATADASGVASADPRRIRHGP
jgi:hypothetical protein